jgi:hypothetical protein
LAKELKMTVADMLDRMTSEELTYWIAYSVLESEDYEHEQKASRVMQSVKR